MDNGDPEARRAVLFQAIENQVRSRNPPEARETLDRLLKEGHTREEAMNLVGCALANEIYGILKSGASYDNARYVANLRRLPQLPRDAEE